MIIFIMCGSKKWSSLLLCVICLIVSIGGQLTHLSCGKRKVKTNYLIRGGIEAIEGFWPWHVAIYHRNEYKCGGSIIDENTILTASHCVYISGGVIPIARVSVHVGQVHLNKSTEHLQIHDVQEIIVHPEFSHDSIIHDIAMIKLSTKITMNKYVQPVCLWAMDSKQELIAGKNGTIVGFGLNEQDVVSGQLKQASIRVVDPLTCIEKDRSVFGTHLTMDMFCGIGHTGVGACNGDSGGGMFFEVRDKWFIRGLVSYTPVREYTNLCDPLKPTAYTDVAKYLNWMKQYIDQRVLLHESDLFEIDYEEKLRLFNFESCGIKSSTIYSDEKNWTTPWIGLVLDEEDQIFYCATTLISEWYTVGPASCFASISEDRKVFINLGGYFKKECYKLDGETLCSYPTQQRQIQHVVNHPQYDRTHYAHNIALIELKTPADTNQPNVKPICFPVTSGLRTTAKSNLHVGIIAYKGVENIPVRSLESVECIKRYTQANGAPYMESNRLCVENANDGGISSCFTKMPGSPLQEMVSFNGTERYFLRGLDLLGMTCFAQQPSFFLNVDPYLDWILYIMKYHTNVNVKYSENSTVNETLEEEWGMMQQQPRGEKLRLFDMNTCGDIPLIQRIVDHVPWIGYLMIAVYAINDRDTDRVVLISQWYALAPKRVVHENMVWRYVFLGKYPKDKRQVVEIKRIVIPSPEHPRQPFALIELLDPADLKNPYIKPICLPFMKSLHRLNSTEVVLTTKIIGDFSTYNCNLTVLDRSSCQERLLWNGITLFNQTLSCAIATKRFRDWYPNGIMGVPFQMHVQFGERSRYFLYGMNVHGEDKFDLEQYGVYLFEKIEIADLEWILESIQQNELHTSFLTVMQNGQMNLKPVRVSASKKALFDFNNCGVSTTNDPMPWIGDTSRCQVTLLSEWYIVGPASCFSNLEKGKWVTFGYHSLAYNASTYKEENHIDRIFIHPNFTGTDYDHDIALAKLSSPVNTSFPSVTPLCLPIIDAIRNFNISSLAIVTNNFSAHGLQITNVDDRYVLAAECQQRWKGLKTNVTIGSSNHCIINKRSSNEEFVRIYSGYTLHSRQAPGTVRNFLRGFAMDKEGYSSIYYPVVYTNTDTYLDWILETMKQQTSPSFDLRKEFIFN